MLATRIWRQVAKLKEQAAYKDKQISGLIGQMKGAGMTPDFESIKQQAAEKALAGKGGERGRASSPSKGKGKGKSKTRSSSAGSDKGCFICGSFKHWQKDCPKAGQYTPQDRANSPANSATSAERKANVPCYNHRPWENPAVNCLKGDQCPFAHPDSKPDGHVYRKPSRGPKGARKGNKVRPRGAQLVRGTVGQMMMAAATLVALSSGPVVTESLQHSAVAGKWSATSKHDDTIMYNSATAAGKTACEKGVQESDWKTWGLASQLSYKCSVDFGSFTVEDYEIPDGNMLWPGGSQTDRRRYHNKKWTTEELHEEMASTAWSQQRMNDRMDGIEKARSSAKALGTPLPPSLNDLEDLMLPVNALVGAESTLRVSNKWDDEAWLY